MQAEPKINIRYPREFSHPRNNHYAQNCRAYPFARIVATIAVLAACIIPTHAQPAWMFNNLYYMAYGNHTAASFGGTGLDYTGKILDTVSNSTTIAQQIIIDTVNGMLNVIPVSGLTYQNFKYDTMAHRLFKGDEYVIKGFLNNDQYPDYVSWSNGSPVHVWLGTPNPDSLVHAFTLDYGSGYGPEKNGVCLYDWDSSGTTGIIIGAYPG